MNFQLRHTIGKWDNNNYLLRIDPADEQFSRTNERSQIRLFAIQLIDKPKRIVPAQSHSVVKTSADAIRIQLITHQLRIYIYIGLRTTIRGSKMPKNFFTNIMKSNEILNELQLQAEYVINKICTNSCSRNLCYTQYSLRPSVTGDRAVMATPH